MKKMSLLMAVLALLIGACEIRKPVLPEWDVTLSIPLMHKNFFVSDLVDSLNIIVGDGDVLTLRGTGTAETPALGVIELTPGIQQSGIPLLSGVQQLVKIPFGDTNGLVELVFGRFNSGFISTRFHNVASEVSQISISIAEIRDPGGQPFQISYDGNSGWDDHSLVNCVIGNPDTNQILDSLSVTMNISSSLPNNSPVGTMDLNLDNPLSFGLFRGALAPYDLPLMNNATTINIDYPYDLEEAIRLQHASMKIDLENQLGFACIFHGDFVAENTRTGETQTIPILNDNGQPFMAEAADENGPGFTELIFTQGVDSLLQIMPDRVSITNAYFTIQSGIGGTIGTVRDADKIIGNYQVDAPFTFELFASTIRLQDPVRINISEDNRRRIQNNALGAELSLKIKNQLPIGVTADLYFGDTDSIDPDSLTSYQLHRTVPLRSKQWVQAHPDDPSVNSEGEQLVSIELSEAEVDLFANPDVFLLWTFSFEPSNGVISINASPADYISVKSMIRVGLHIAEDI